MSTYDFKGSAQYFDALQILYQVTNTLPTSAQLLGQITNQGKIFELFDEK